MHTSNRAERLRQTILRAYPQASVEVVDQSAHHAGHAGASAAGETHYDVTVTTDEFLGMSRVARARAVQDLLGSEFEGGLHALSLRLRARREGEGR